MTDNTTFTKPFPGILFSSVHVPVVRAFWPHAVRASTSAASQPLTISTAEEEATPKRPSAWLAILLACNFCSLLLVPNSSAGAVSARPRQRQIAAPNRSLRYTTMWPLLLAIAAWVLVVQLLRWRQGRRLAAISNGQQLVAEMQGFAHPVFWRKGLEYALLKSACCIPSVSSLLHKTQEFANDPPKRYDDTDLLLQEILHNDLDSDRAMRAMKRMNDIHGMYNISNDDFKYVLSTFVVDVHRFIDKYGTHPFTAHQRTAHTNLWLEIGRRMNIKDLPKDLAELEAYHDAYESAKMRYAPSNIAVLNPLLDMLFAGAPKFMHGPAVVVVSALCEPLVRESLRLPEPPGWLPPLLDGLLKARAACVYWLVPPGIISNKRVPDAPDAQGRMRTTFNMYGCTYADKGYRIEELGPCPFGPSSAAQNGKQA